MVFLLDGITPSLSEAGNQPQININSQGWVDIGYISVLISDGFGNYHASLSDLSVSQQGTILSQYQGVNTIQAFGEPIQVVPQLSLVPIFDDPTSPPTINTYVSLPEAEQYFSVRLNSDSWYNAVQKDKIAALTMATMDINQLNFIGCKADPSQPLAFPRNIAQPTPSTPVYLSITGIVYYNDPYNNMPNPLVPTQPILINPPQINSACCEIAYNYLDGVEIETELNRLLVTHQHYTNVTEAYASANEAKRAGINSNKAWIYLKPYVNNGFQLTLTKW